MRGPVQRMTVALPVPEAADLSTRAAQCGVPTDEYLGIQALAGAYGRRHPLVAAFDSRGAAGDSGPAARGD